MTEGHVFIATSLDGQIARPDGTIDWLLSRDDSARTGEDFGYGAFIAGMDGIVMGSGTYGAVRGMSPWRYDLPVVVMTARPQDWSTDPPPMVHFTSDGPADLMAKLAAQGWRHVYVDGGAVIRSFLAAGLIAELTLTQVPVLIGAGRPLFGAVPADIGLDHLATRSFANGMVQSRYRVRR